MIWLNKALIQIGHDSRHRHIIYSISKGLQEWYLVPSFKSSQVTIMVWTCFCSDKIGPIFALNQGGFSAVEYMEILFDGLMPMIDNLLQQPAAHTMICVTIKYSLLFMSNNVPCYMDHWVSKFLEEHGIAVMPWPS